MKLIYISTPNVPSRWAHSFQTMKMAEALAQRVDDFTFITGRAFFRSPKEDVAQWYGVQPFRIVRLPAYPGKNERDFSPSSYRRFCKLAALYARWESPDFVYARAMPAGAFSIKLKLPTILETHSFPEHDEIRSILPVLDHKHLVGVVTVTEYLKERYRKAGVPESKICVWPDAVNLENFKGLPSVPVLRKELGLPADLPVITYCGHFYEHKGVRYIIDAARLLPDVFFCLIGGWPEDIEKMKRLANSLNNLVFPGFVSNNLVPRYLRASDLLLLPNSMKYEEAHATSPLKLFEYMASHRPIIASDIPAFRTVLSHLRNAYLVEPDSAEAISTAIQNMLADRALGSRLADEAWKDVQNYTWANRARDVLSFFHA